jgi:hypothetical protein
LGYTVRMVTSETAIQFKPMKFGLFPFRNLSAQFRPAKARFAASADSQISV